MLFFRNGYKQIFFSLYKVCLETFFPLLTSKNCRLFMHILPFNCNTDFLNKAKTKWKMFDDIYNHRPRLPPPTDARRRFFSKIVLLVAGNVGSLFFHSPTCLSLWLPLVSFSPVSWSQLNKRHNWEQRKSEWKSSLLPHIKRSHITDIGQHG